jgi:hypothetical protein
VRIVLDTNVISNLMRPEPHPAVLGWVAAQPRDALRMLNVFGPAKKAGLPGPGKPEADRPSVADQHGKALRSVTPTQLPPPLPAAFGNIHAAISREAA